MTTPNLEITELVNGQTDQYITANEAFRALERAMCGRFVHNFDSDANYTLVTTAGSEEWWDKFMEFTDTSSPQILTAGRDVIFPAKNGPEYIVKNSTGQTLTLKISGQSGVALSAGSTGRYYYNGTDIVAGP